mmetsp:Transcript_52509/g.137584  ORF Transcript_52509/g.137584 Transcript_52509/m.137584 type:complete len:213 (-) Transcript_52509:2802-3440(-)
MDRHAEAKCLGLASLGRQSRLPSPALLTPCKHRPCSHLVYKHRPGSQNPAWFLQKAGKGVPGLGRQAGEGRSGGGGGGDGGEGRPGRLLGSGQVKGKSSFRAGEECTHERKGKKGRDLGRGGIRRQCASQARMHARIAPAARRTRSRRTHPPAARRRRRTRPPWESPLRTPRRPPPPPAGRRTNGRSARCAARLRARSQASSVGPWQLLRRL